MVAQNVRLYARLVMSIVTIAMIISAVIAKPARIALKETAGATTAMSAVTAFQISVYVAKAVLTA